LYWLLCRLFAVAVRGGTAQQRHVEPRLVFRKAGVLVVVENWIRANAKEKSSDGQREDRDHPLETAH